MVKVTFEFPTVDAAIVALAKLAAPLVKGAQPASAVTGAPPAANGTAPAAPATARKGRADKGQKRGPYTPRAEEAKGGGVDGGTATAATAPDAAKAQDAPPPAASTITAAAQPGGSVVGAPADQAAVTDSGKAAEQAANPKSTPADAAAVPEAAAMTALEKVFEAKPPKGGMEAAVKLLKDFGCAKLRDLKPEQRADFIKAAEQALA